MSDSSVFEIAFIIAILVIQFFICFNTWIQIKSIKDFLGNPDNLKLGSSTIEQEIDVDDYDEDGQLYKRKEKTLLSINVIYLHKDEVNKVLRRIIQTINNYLRKNKGGAADFNLIKDIVERQCDSIDEEINQKLPAPIYLGLMGTVFGIIIGLFSLDFQIDPETGALNGTLFVESVSGLINGVKLAMICSLFGLLETTFMSSYLYRGAKAKLERQKNDFYDFIQSELLPQMTRDAASTILALQANLEKFNESFDKNIEGFSSIMDDIHAAFDSQVQLQKEMKNMDLAQVAHLNVNVLAQLRESMRQFEQFTQYLNQMNSFVRQTAKLTDSVNDQLERTEAIEQITIAMRDNIQKNQLVMNKLRDFLERINEQQAVITATGTLDSVMAQAIDELRAHTQEQISDIKSYTTEATADLKELVNAERGHLSQLNNLSKLNQLDSLVRAIESLKAETKNANAELGNKVVALANAVTQNTRAQRGEDGIPGWLKFSLITLIMLASIVFIGNFVYDTWIKEDPTPLNTSASSTSVNTNNGVISKTDSVKVDSIKKL